MISGGFNIFDDSNDDFRTYFGYGQEIEVLLDEIADGSIMLSLNNCLVLALGAFTVSSLAF